MSRGMSLNVGVKGLKRGTSINDIKIPDLMRVRKSSGISWVDKALGGQGFVPSQVMMLTGMPGCGKTTFSLQLADSLTKEGNVVLYNTGEESIYQVKMTYERIGLKHGFVIGQDIQMKDALTHLKELKAAHPKKQIFYIQDSLQTLDDGKYNNGFTNGNTPVRCAEMICDWAKANAGIAIFIGQVTKNGEFSGKNTIKHAVDTHAHMYIDDQKKSDTYRERLFEVTKNRWGCNGRTYILGMGRSGLYDKGYIEQGELMDADGNVVGIDEE